MLGAPALAMAVMILGHRTTLPPSPVIHLIFLPGPPESHASGEWEPQRQATQGGPPRITWQVEAVAQGSTYYPTQESSSCGLTQESGSASPDLPALTYYRENPTLRLTLNWAALPQTATISLTSSPTPPAQPSHSNPAGRIMVLPPILIFIFPTFSSICDP